MLINGCIKRYQLPEICNRCRLETNKTYSCEHTNDKKMCTECYQEIHWLINTHEGITD
jgi:hypothetical protein